MIFLNVTELSADGSSKNVDFNKDDLTAMFVNDWPSVEM